VKRNKDYEEKKDGGEDAENVIISKQSHESEPEHSGTGPAEASAMKPPPKKGLRVWGSEKLGKFADHG